MIPSHLFPHVSRNVFTAHATVHYNVITSEIYVALSMSPSARHTHIIAQLYSNYSWDHEMPLLTTTLHTIQLGHHNTPQILPLTSTSHAAKVYLVSSEEVE